MKKVLSAISAVTLVFFLLIPAAAQSEGYVYDNAKLLDNVPGEVVQSLLEQLNTDYGVSMYIITRNSDDEKEKLNVEGYSQKFCDEKGLGKNGDKGLLAVFDVDKNMSYFYPYGSRDIFSNDFMNGLFETVNKYYSGGEYYSMYLEIIKKVDGYLYEKVGLQKQPNIIDNAGLLSDDEESLLLQKIENIVETYSFDVAIITTNGIGNKTIAEYSDDSYDYGGYGIGPNYDGLAFVINMGDRDYYTTTCGYGITAFTDYGIEKMCEDVVPLLTSGDYYEAFSLYLDNVSLFLEQAKTGKPYDVGNKLKTTEDYVAGEIIVLVVSLVISAIIAFSVRSSMNNAKAKTSATNYIKRSSVNAAGSAGGVNLKSCSDVFMYSTTSKTPKQSSSSSGGSSTHIGSSGRSHGGGGGKF